MELYDFYLYFKKYNVKIIFGFIFNTKKKEKKIATILSTYFLKIVVK